MACGNCEKMSALWGRAVDGEKRARRDLDRLRHVLQVLASDKDYSPGDVRRMARFALSRYEQTRDKS
jgi:hypothetical protein